jgi:O-methyltransferase
MSKNTRMPVALTSGVDRCVKAGKRRFLLVPANELAVRLAATIRERHASEHVEVVVWDFEWQAQSEVQEDLTSTSWPSQAQGWLPDVVLVCEDEQKLLVLSALNRLSWTNFPEVISFGSAHHELNQHTAEALEQRAGETSNAVGYHFAKAHFWELLNYFNRTGKRGTIVELGVFRGGTLLLISEMLRAIGSQGNRLVGFDTWSGFPRQRTLLDMYSDEQFVYRDFAAVESRLGKQGIELIRGDIVETIATIKTDNLLLSFLDTDNYTPVRHALPLIADRTIAGGAIIFDHYYALEEFNDALGEGVAAFEFFAARPDFLNLSGTGVFLKIP